LTLASSQFKLPINVFLQDKSTNCSWWSQSQQLCQFEEKG
jgi:hypothetical protein